MSSQSCTRGIANGDLWYLVESWVPLRYIWHALGTQHWGLLRVIGILILCNHTVGMHEHQSPAVASQLELLLKSVGAVSALEDSEFKRDIVQKVFFVVVVVVLYFVCLFCLLRQR